MCIPYIAKQEVQHKKSHLWDMRRFAFLHVFLTLFLSGTAVYGQNLSNRGTEFWLGYGFQYSFFHEPPVNTQELQVYVSTRAAANVTVTVMNTGWSRTLAVPANSVDFSITIPKSGPDDARILREGLSNRAIRIQSDVPVAAYAHQYNTQVSGATMLMPLETYGRTYFSVNYAQFKSGSTHPYDPVNTMANGDDWYSWFYVVAPEDGTRVRITPSDSTQGGWLPGNTYTVDLKKGEIYNVMGLLRARSGPAWQASKDLTGSRIVSVTGTDGKCHPIAVFSGSGGIRLCRGDGGEYMGQQMLPARAWGSRYLTYHMVNNTQTDISTPFLNFYRVCVTDPSTVVRRNGQPLNGLVNGTYYEFGSTTGDYITSDKPVLVSQYTPNANQCATMNIISYGDPEMIYLSPIEQGQDSILFFTPRKAFIDYVYGSIYLPTPAIPSLRVDGSALPASNIIPHPTLPSYSVALARFTGPAAPHRITCDSIFNAYIYGIGLFESYGFNAGTLVNDLNSSSFFRNVYRTVAGSDSFTCPKTPFRAYVEIAYAVDRLHWRLSEVPGLNPGRDTIIPTPTPVATFLRHGRTYYRYSLDVDLTLPLPGTYDIPFTYSAPDIDQCDRTESGTVRVVVKPGPRADFDTTGTYCLKDTIQLRGTSDTTGFRPVAYRWDFTDATRQDTRDARKRFATDGNQPVRYRVFTDIGCTGDTIKQVRIQQTQGLAVAVRGNPCRDSVLSFRSSILSSQTGSRWFWDFGDGTVDSSRTSDSSRHAYVSAAAVIRYRHWVVGPGGCPSDTATGSLTIHPTPPAPVIEIISDTLCPGRLIRIDARVSYAVRSWAWDLGDGIRLSSHPPVSRTFPLPGTYPVRLSVIDGNGCGSAVGMKDVMVNRLPDIDAGPDVFIQLGASATLGARITDPSLHRYLWLPALQLDDATLLNPLCRPLKDTRYVIEAYNSVTRCTASDSMQVYVLTRPQVPNTFTPNGDGVNDRWEIRHLDKYPGCVVEVYATTGTLMYRSVGYSVPWDATLNGRPLPSGTYYYAIDLKTGDPRMTGYVTVIR
jgi:gliding motility-associated-like protein